MMTRLSKAIGLILLGSFAIRDVSAQTEYLVKIDQATGVHTKINSLPGVNWIMITSTFDEINHRYIFKGSSDNQNWDLYSVDAITGSIISNPSFPAASIPGDNVIELEHDNASGILYGLLWDQSENTEYFISIDPANGSYTKINSLPGVKWIMTDNTTFDKVHHRYIFKGGDDNGNWFLYSIDAITGNIISNPSFPATSSISSGSVTGLQYDNVSDKYYGLYFNTQNMAYFVSVDPVNGLFTEINTLPINSVTLPSTYDEINHRYIIKGVHNDGTWNLFSIDATTGNIISNPVFPVLTDPADNVIDLQYDNSSATLFALHWDANKKDPEPPAPPPTGISNNQLNNPLFNLYPNPFTAGSKITLDKSYREITVFIYNSVGQVVGKETVFNTSTVAIQRGALASGTYFVSVICDHKNIGVKKIVAE